MKAKVFSFSQHKGGVGKTTTTATLGAALAQKGNKVLVIDLDAQQNLTYSLMNAEPEESIYDSLTLNKPIPIVYINENLDLVPASIELAKAEIDLSTRMARERILKNLLDTIKDKYDFIFLDCPPSLGIVTTNALVAADKLIIPMTAEVLPLKGLKMLDEVVDEVKKLVNHNLEIGGVLLNRFDKRKTLNIEILNTLYKTYGNKVFETKIRENIALAETAMTGKTIFEYAPKSNGAKDYLALADEFVEKFSSK